MKIELNKVYEDGEGKQWKVIAYCPDRYQPSYFAHSPCQMKIRYFSEEGYFYIYSYGDSRNLIKLIGDNFANETTD